MLEHFVSIVLVVTELSNIVSVQYTERITGIRSVDKTQYINYQILNNRSTDI